jgi:WD40 repeat protein
MGHSGPVLAMAFSPDGKTIVTGSGDRSVKVWAAEDGRLIRSFSHHTDAVHALVFRPRVFDDVEGRPAMCVTGGADRTARVWQPEIGRMVRIVRQHQGPIFAVAFSPDARTFFSAGKEGIVRRIDAESDSIIEQWKVSEEWIYALAVSPDGSTLATGEWAGSVRVRNVQK